jgi:hypothetical protein
VILERGASLHLSSPCSQGKVSRTSSAFRNARTAANEVRAGGFIYEHIDPDGLGGNLALFNLSIDSKLRGCDVAAWARQRNLRTLDLLQQSRDVSISAKLKCHSAASLGA